jgi:outer membrane lipoprotein-sorting protein
MHSRSSLGLLVLSIGLAWSSPIAAQGTDPLTRFLHGLLKPDENRGEAASADDKAGAAARKPSRPASSASRSRTEETAAPPEPASSGAGEALAGSKPRSIDRRRPTGPEAPTVAAPLPPTPPALPVVPASASQQAAPLPTTPAAAIERLNAHFNGIDALTATFVQTAGGQRSQGTLSLKRPGQMRFAYAPPSTLEIVSDGRSVAIRDRKLGTNDVYPIGQTPLKFLLQDHFDLARDTKIRNVQTNPDGTIVVRFDDSATFGGTSKVTLHFDARRNRLREWTIVDPQGYETTIVLSGVDVVTRGAAD